MQEPEEQRQSEDLERKDREHDARLAASARLVAEMESLVERAYSLHNKNVEILKKLNST
jgi:hypothetical protein